MSVRRRAKGVQVRGRAEIIEGTRVRFFCPHGHSQVEDMNRKSLPKPKRLDEAAVRLLVRWWSHPNNGVNFECRTCSRDLDRALNPTQSERVYGMFMADPETLRSSYLYDHFERGQQGIMRPQASQERALAAWRAGRDRKKMK